MGLFIFVSYCKVAISDLLLVLICGYMSHVIHLASVNKFIRGDLYGKRRKRKRDWSRRI